MSIRAMNWAMQQVRTDGPSAQILLYVIADVANENGVSIHGDPDYLAERTRQSRATVFRRLNELEKAGALTRFTRHTNDGKRLYEVRLHLDRSINYISVDDATEDGDGAQAVDAESQIETVAESQIETAPRISPVRLAESHSCDPQENPSKSPKDSPLPPSGGNVCYLSPESEEQLKEFAATYPAPITDYQRTRATWAAMNPTERTESITGAKGYRAYIEDLKRKGKERAVKDAHRWLRDKAWLGYLIAGKSAEVKAERFQAPENSDEWKAWDVFYRICGERGIPTFLTFAINGQRIATVPQQWPPVGREYDPNSQAGWVRVFAGSGSYAAWKRRLEELPNIRIWTRVADVEGKPTRYLNVPSEWPPNRGTGPPRGWELADEQMAEFK